MHGPPYMHCSLVPYTANYYRPTNIIGSGTDCTDMALLSYYSGDRLTFPVAAIYVFLFSLEVSRMPKSSVTNIII
jgi:hypothetical protein